MTNRIVESSPPLARAVLPDGGAAAAFVPPLL